MQCSAVKTGLRLSVCHCVSLWALSQSHFLIDFHQNDTDVRTFKCKIALVEANIAPHFPRNPHFRTNGLKIHANINNPISALNVRKSPKFLRLIGNQGRGM